MHAQGRLSSHETTQMLQAEGLAESDLIPGKYEGTHLLNTHIPDSRWRFGQNCDTNDLQ